MSIGQLDTLLRHVRRLADVTNRDGFSDGQLLARFQADREESAFTALMRRHSRLVWSVCRHVLRHEQDAEDAFQATFLVLARKADSIRKTEAVGSWLHGAAYRIAMRAKRDAAIRRKHEGRAGSVSCRVEDHPAANTAGSPERTMSLREGLAVLDEEVQRLPAKHRAVFVACCLEGKTMAETARELGWKEGTVSGTLSRAKERLRSRLARRGVTLSAALAALALTDRVTASLPVKLFSATLEAALRYAAGGPAPAALSALIRAASSVALFTKAKIAGVLVALAASACCFAFASSPSDKSDAASAKQQAKAEPQPAKEDAVAYSGRVVDPDGKPVAGAKVYFQFLTRADEPTPVRATTDENGRFAFSLTPKDVPLSADSMEFTARKVGFIVVKADSFAFAWHPPIKGTKDIAFHLARDDSPIQGRMLDLQGKPIAGVRVTVLSAAMNNEGDLSPFLQALKDRKSLYESIVKHLPNFLHNPFISRREVTLLPSTKTDAEGRFRIPGFAREQLIELRVEGPTVERQEFYVLNRAKPAGSDALLTTNRQPADRMYGAAEKAILRWNGFEYAAAPGQVVVGTVRDADSKVSLPGAIIESYVLAGTNLAQNTLYHTVADAQGRYRFTGLPRGKGNQIRIRPPKGEPYIPLVKSVPPKDALVEATVDADLPRGVFVDVTAKDKATGRPVPGSVSYFTFPDKIDPNMPFFSGPFSDSYDNFMAIRNDGTFRFVAVSRKAILAFRADWTKYPIAKEADALQLPSALSASNFMAFAELNPKVGDDPVTVDFVLDTGGVTKIRVVDPDGKPLPGTLAAGLRHDWFTGADWPGMDKAGEYLALGLDPMHPRLLCFAHWDKKLAGSVVVRGDEKAPVTVKLQPWASVKGRLLNANGQPIKNETLWFTELPPLNPGKYRALDNGLHVVERSGYKPSPDPRTDADGNFQVEGLIPGLKYNLALRDSQGAFAWDQIKWQGLAFSNLVLKPGESKDLGDVKLQPFPKK